jgi:hypothetical protein
MCSAFVDVLQAKDNVALARENLQSFQNIVEVNTTRPRRRSCQGGTAADSGGGAAVPKFVRQNESKLKIALNACKP